MKKCYLSGPVSSLTFAQADYRFSCAAKKVSDLGMTPVNPLNNPLPHSAPWIMHIIVDCITLISCSSVAMLPDWHTSRGARIEFQLAMFLGKKILYV